MTQPAASSSSAAAAATFDALTGLLLARYAAAERRLLTDLARAAQAYMADPAAQAQAVLLTAMRRSAQAVAADLAQQAWPLAERIVQRAASDGIAAAQRELRALAAGRPELARWYMARRGEAGGQGLTAANMIALDLATKLHATRYGILRTADDAYRAVIADVTMRLVRGTEQLTPFAAQSKAFLDLTERGVGGIIDSRGRQWNLATYVEMATRTATVRAYNDAHQARMTALGIHYFTVPRDGHPCPLCRPWEGAILSDGATGNRVETNPATGAQVGFNIAATIEEARIAGLWHPNCRHTLLPYLPGVTKVNAPQPWTQADADRYNALQHLRNRELKARNAQLRFDLAGFLEDRPARRKAAANHVRYQQQIRELVANHGLVRRPRREQINLGL